MSLYINMYRKAHVEKFQYFIVISPSKANNYEQNKIQSFIYGQNNTIQCFNYDSITDKIKRKLSFPYSVSIGADQHL